MAKFKVGDKVKVAPGKIMGGKTGVVVKIGTYPLSREAMFVVKMDDGTTVDWREEEIVKNSRACNALMSLEELLQKNGLSKEEFNKMVKEIRNKGASAVHFVRGKDGRLVFKADGTTIGNSVVSNALYKNFKPGDKVIVHWSDWRGDDKGKILEKGKYGWVVAFDDLSQDQEVNEKLITLRNSTDPVVANAMAYAGRKANVVANSWASHEHLGDLKKAMFYANIDYSRLEKEGLGMWSSMEEYANKEFYRKNQHYLKAVEPFGQDKDIGQKAKAFASILKTAKPVKEDFRKLKDAAAELNDEVIRLTVGR